MGNPPSAPEGSTEMLVRTKLVRTMFCALGASTLVLGGTTAPASASGDHNDDEVKVLVCVRIDDGHNDEVDITVSTDRDDDEATIEDGDCERFRLEFDDNRLEVEADTNDDVRFRVFGDAERSRSRDGVLRVTFDDDEDTPFVGVSVRVEDDHHHHHHG
jgi:hypothetical protein